MHGAADAIAGHWEAFRGLSFYEDGLFTAHSRPFDFDPAFEAVYSHVAATAVGYDPHHRWRAHVFAGLFLSRMPGLAVEFGSARGFTVHFALALAEERGLLDAIAANP